MTKALRFFSIKISRTFFTYVSKLYFILYLDNIVVLFINVMFVSIWTVFQVGGRERGFHHLQVELSDEGRKKKTRHKIVTYFSLIVLSIFSGIGMAGSVLQVFDFSGGTIANIYMRDCYNCLTR